MNGNPKKMTEKSIKTTLPKIKMKKLSSDFQASNMSRSLSSSISEKNADPVNLFNSVMSLTENDKHLVYDLQKRLNDQK